MKSGTLNEQTEGCNYIPPLLNKAGNGCIGEYTVTSCDLAISTIRNNLVVLAELKELFSVEISKPPFL
jgi:hypothetical protein